MEVYTATKGRRETQKAWRDRDLLNVSCHAVFGGSWLGSSLVVMVDCPSPAKTN
jgi:hypothetical protein